MFVLPARPTTTKLAWGQSWRNHQQNGGLLLMLGSSTFMVSFPLWAGLLQLLQVFFMPIPSFSLSESYFCSPKDMKTAYWSWVPLPPCEGMKLKRLSGVNMVHMACFWDNTLNYDWGLPLTQAPPALASHTHSCPGSYCPLRSSQSVPT